MLTSFLPQMAMTSSEYARSWWSSTSQVEEDSVVETWPVSPHSPSSMMTVSEEISPSLASVYASSSFLTTLKDIMLMSSRQRLEDATSNLSLEVINDGLFESADDVAPTLLSSAAASLASLASDHIEGNISLGLDVFSDVAASASRLHFHLESGDNVTSLPSWNVSGFASSSSDDQILLSVSYSYDDDEEEEELVAAASKFFTWAPDLSTTSWFDWFSVNVTDLPIDYRDGEKSGAADFATTNLTNLTMGGCGFLGATINNNGSATDCSLFVTSPTYQLLPSSIIPFDNDTSTDQQLYPEQEYWALILILFPLFTIFGNVLVILSVYKERNLQTVTNYFIVSLAVADLLVAALVMPFAVYVLVNVNWELSPTLCDFYIAMDVTCSTSSIFNLVAISIDRFMAVTRPIKYAKHKNNQRVVLTIVIVWLVSAAIGTPIVLGLNTTPDRGPTLCVFYNSDFIIFSSLSSFYIPCIIMVFLYYKIFKVIRERAKKSAAAKRSSHAGNVSDLGAVESHGRRLQPLMPCLGRQARSERQSLCRHKEMVTLCVSLEPDGPTVNTESGSQENDEDDADLVEEGLVHCQVVRHEQTTELILGPVTDDGRSSSTHSSVTVVAPTARSSPPPLLLMHRDLTSNGANHDSGYGASHVEETTFQSDVGGGSVLVVVPKDTGINGSGGGDGRTLGVRYDGSRKSMERRSGSVSRKTGNKRNGTDRGLSGSVKSSSGDRSIGERQSTHDGSLSPTRRKRPRFHLSRSHKSSRKKREKSAAKKERKATKTLAIVLGVFLFCWMPFFTCNILDAICIKLNKPSWQPGYTMFVLTTWLGYMNSFINPVIYTIFNPEFRKAFKKILCEN